jgi:hypothetical protein
VYNFKIFLWVRNFSKVVASKSEGFARGAAGRLPCHIRGAGICGSPTSLLPRTPDLSCQGSGPVGGSCRAQASHEDREGGRKPRTSWEDYSRCREQSSKGGKKGEKTERKPHKVGVGWAPLGGSQLQRPPRRATAPWWSPATLGAATPAPEGLRGVGRGGGGGELFFRPAPFPAHDCTQFPLGPHIFKSPCDEPGTVILLSPHTSPLRWGCAGSVLQTESGREREQRLHN